MKILALTFLFIYSAFATDDFNIEKVKIYDVTEKTAKIKISKVFIGQSGIIIKNAKDNITIVKSATIIDFNKNEATIEFLDKQILVQDALPTSAHVPVEGDIFIVNHLYKTSLLIVPNLKAKKVVQALYPDQNFLNEDFFAAHLKLTQTPIPTKQTILDFTQKQQIGTLFVVIENKLFILDASTFAILNTIEIKNDDLSQNVPFFTKIDDIKKGFWDFGADKIEDYNKHYLELLEKK